MESGIHLLRCLALCWFFQHGSGCSAQWQSLAGGLNSHVVALWAMDTDTSLLVAGDFGTANGNGSHFSAIAKWKNGAWTAEGTGGGSGDTTCVAACGYIPTIAMFHDSLFVGTQRQSWHYDTSLAYSVVWDGAQWADCGDPNSMIFHLVANGRLFGGGVAQYLYGQFIPGVREWIGGAYQPIPNNPFTVPAAIYAADYWQGQYYFGGVYNVLGSKRMVAYDGVDAWTGLAGGVGGVQVRSVRGYHDSLYVGGYFLEGLDVPSNHLVIWDGQAWKPSFQEVVFDSQVFDMEVHNDELYVLGIYHFVDDTTHYGILRFDGEQICAIGGPMFGDNADIAFVGNDLYMGAWAGFTGFQFQYIVKLPLDGLVPDRCEVVTTVPEESAGAVSLLISPNPATGSITIASRVDMRNAQVEIYDAVGRCVQRERVTATALTLKLDVTELTAGWYTVRMARTEGTTQARFVKQ